MVIDYFGAWLVEIAMKWLFATKPLPELITRGSERRDKRRALAVADEKKALASKKEL
jgi:cation-transporting ATPase 13A1